MSRLNTGLLSCGAMLVLACGGPAQETKPLEKPRVSAQAQTKKKNGALTKLEIVSSDNVTASSRVKPRKTESYATLEELCSAWPEIAADDDDQGRELEDIGPLSCKATDSPLLPAPVAPFTALKLVDVTADSYQGKILVAKLADKWHWISVVDETREANRRGSGIELRGVFFQDLVPNRGAELVLVISGNEWHMDHDDDEQTYERTSESIDICQSNGDGGVACAELAFAGSSDGDGAPEEAYRYRLELKADDKGRVHIGGGSVEGEAEERAKQMGVFEISF